MAVYHAFGDVLVSQDEINSRVAQNGFRDFHTALLNKADASFDFSLGTATTENILRSATLVDGGKEINFEPIGIGKPLTVQVRHVYTGNKGHGFWGDKDMLVASAMKSIAAYDAAPRAINFMVKRAKNNRNFRTVDATDKGSPLICYSPALTQSSSVVTVEVMFSGFPKEAFDAVAQVFSSAGALPVFAAASGYLVAAGIVTKLVGTLGKALTDGTPALKRTEEITFITPGSPTAIARFVLLMPDAAPASLLNGYEINNRGALAQKKEPEKLYDGEYPYAVISLDGRQNDDFKTFAPTAATAAELDKFYNIHDGSSQPLGTLVEALKLYNDMKFRDKAHDAAEKLKTLDKDSAEYKALKALYDGYVSNIGNKDLKPSTA